MHPTEIMELMIVSAVVFVILVISYLIKGKWKKVGWFFAGLIVVGYCIFYFARPYWIDWQIEQKVVLLEEYLVEQFPDEKWEIKTVPHREEGYKHLNPYYIGVIFERDPDVIYHYWVEDEDDIQQIAYTTDDQRVHELEFFER